MYESPIKMIYEAVQTQFEDAVLEVVQKVGINVDKDELIRALKYDRDQYNYGYGDGWDAKEASIVRCKDCWKRGDEDFCPLVNDNCYPPTLPDDWFCKDGERRDDDE